MTITIGSGITIGNGITIDGYPTTPVLPSANITWYAATYGNGKFVAVGPGVDPTTGAVISGTTSAVSSQGTGTWTATTITGGQWSSVTYGGGKFVAVGRGSVGAYSSDGVTWSASTLPTNQEWTGVSYGAGLFVAVGKALTGLSTTTYATSSDGINWTGQTRTGGWTLNTVNFVNSRFVALENGGYAYTSVDGTTWAVSGDTNLNAPVAITYGAGVYVAADGGGGGFIAYSSDAVTWTRDSGIATGVYWTSIEYGNGLFVTVGFDSPASQPICMTSPDAINWTARTMPAATHYDGLAFGPGMYEGFVAVGYDNAGALPPYIYNPQVAVSRDGINWY